MAEASRYCWDHNNHEIYMLPNPNDPGEEFKDSPYIMCNCPDMASAIFHTNNSKWEATNLKLEDLSWEQAIGTISLIDENGICRNDISIDEACDVIIQAENWDDYDNLEDDDHSDDEELDLESNID